MTTEGEGAEAKDVLSLHARNHVVLEAQVSHGSEDVFLMCGSSYVHLRNTNGQAHVEVTSAGSLLVHAAGHLQLEGDSVQILAKGGRVSVKDTVRGGSGFAGHKALNKNTGRTKPAIKPPAAGVSSKCVDKVVAAMPPEYRRSPTARRTVENIMSEAAHQGVTDKAQIAYMLATAQRESSFGTDMTEGWGPSANQRHYDTPGDPKNLGNHANPDPNSRYTNGDGYRYRGRGYVQITGLNHYKEWSKMLGVDLVKNPELAVNPKYAAQIMVQGMTHGLFTGHSLSKYIDSSKGLYDFHNARTVVNGHDKADEIAGNAHTYLRALDKCE